MMLSHSSISTLGVSLAIIGALFPSSSGGGERERTPFGSRERRWRTLRTLVLIRHPRRTFAECGNQLHRLASSVRYVTRGIDTSFVVFELSQNETGRGSWTWFLKNCPASQSTALRILEISSNRRNDNPLSQNVVSRMGLDFAKDRRQCFLSRSPSFRIRCHSLWICDNQVATNGNEYQPNGLSPFLCSPAPGRCAKIGRRQCFWVAGSSMVNSTSRTKVRDEMVYNLTRPATIQELHLFCTRIVITFCNVEYPFTLTHSVWENIESLA
jgi:hypothetical protein